MTLKKNKTNDTPVVENQSNKKSNQDSAKDVIIRIWRALVAASIAYAIVVIVMGTDGYLPKVMLIPAGIYGAFLLIKR